MHEVQVLRLVRDYINAWNSHDFGRILGLFAPGGTYTDPNCSEGVDSERLVRYLSELVSAFPDLRREGSSRTVPGADMVTVEWVMTGTNSGSFRGLPATGKEIAVPGVDIVESRAGQIHSIRSYFDSSALFKQLDALVLVLPKTMGPFKFGEATYTSVGSKARPGVIGITQIQVGGPENAERLRSHTSAILQAISTMPGYISTITGLTWDGHGMTVTAWEDMESAKRALQSDAHRAATRAFYKEGLGRSVWTSLWTEGQLNVRWQRCDGCGNMSVVSTSLRCKCGEGLAEPPWL